MAITVQKNIFKLDTKNTTYILMVDEADYVEHLYYGGYIKDYYLPNLNEYQGRAFSPAPASHPFEDERFSLDLILQEYSGSGCGDFRSSCLVAEDDTGYDSVALTYKGYEICEEKPKMGDLPGTHSGKEKAAKTLALQLVDEVREIEVILYYTVYEDTDAIVRSVRLKNIGTSKVKVKKAMSACLDFVNGDMDCISFCGSWANERQKQREKIAYGVKELYSKRGTSSHQCNPVTILCAKDTVEDYGSAYAFGLVYSSNFSIRVEKSQAETIRLTMGINPEGFQWVLDHNEEFHCPEVVMTYSKNGLNGVSQSFHAIVNNNICRGKWIHKRRPVLINNWEATYFDFTEEKILTLADQAKELGIELLVLDDGWFGHRDTDNSSLGDWFTYSKKLPNGLKNLAIAIQERGLKFGLWFEPEMISKDSELYKEHSDWVLSQSRRPKSVSRNQYVLDYTRDEVIDGIWSQIDAILKEVPIDYIKWDMNRHLTEVGSEYLGYDRKGETYHRYMLGVYKLMKRLVTTYPNLLLENCSGGGGRFDLGMLCYSPQIWTSDDTDAVERMYIQNGTSYIYPISCMGAHVSAVPNHQTGRSTPIETRGNVAMFGVLGYELDLTKLSQTEKKVVKDQIKFYKENAEKIQNGKLYRIQAPEQSTWAAWEVVSAGASDLYILYVNLKAKANSIHRVIQIPYADCDKQYVLEGTDEVYYGSTLCNVGYRVCDVDKEYSSVILHFIQR